MRVGKFCNNLEYTTEITFLGNNNCFVNPKFIFLEYLCYLLFFILFFCV